jgi:hypothetical protein
MKMMKKFCLLACLSLSAGLLRHSGGHTGWDCRETHQPMFSPPPIPMPQPRLPIPTAPGDATPTLVPATPTPEFTATPEVRYWWTGLKRPEGQN